MIGRQTTYDAAVDMRERDDLLGQIDTATERLAAAVRVMSDAQVGEPSLLPGWTRGHVLTHVARSGDVLRGLLAGARTGVPGSGYASADAREADIAAGAARPAAEQLDDVLASAQAFRAEAETLTAETARVPVRILTYPEFPTGQCLLRRLVELELHHVDLGLAYTASDWPEAFASRELPEPMSGQRADRL